MMPMPINQLTYPLSVLVKAVEFKNLSSASLHVGLSQPQLSRMIAKLEEELGVELLNRQVKRKSSWTPRAAQLAHLFERHQRRLDHAIHTLQSSQVVRQIHIGTLEGLTDLAVTLSKRLFDKLGIETVTLDVFDRAELEARFLSGDLDVILNTRTVSRGKPKYQHVCAYQTLEHVENPGDFQLYSTYEHSQRARKKAVTTGKQAVATPTVISNSLYVRKTWLDRYGGKSSMPSSTTDKPRRGSDEIMLLGGDWLDPRVWTVLCE
jgi:molybdenum-dependent DNA-binding transcriptional regulator ModE